MPLALTITTSIAMNRLPAAGASGSFAGISRQPTTASERSPIFATSPTFTGAAGLDLLAPPPETPPVLAGASLPGQPVEEIATATRIGASVRQERTAIDST